MKSSIFQNRSNIVRVPKSGNNGQCTLERDYAGRRTVENLPRVELLPLFGRGSVVSIRFGG